MSSILRNENLAEVEKIETVSFKVVNMLKTENLTVEEVNYVMGLVSTLIKQTIGENLFV